MEKIVFSRYIAVVTKSHHMYINKAEANIFASALFEAKRKIAQQAAIYIDEVEPVLKKLNELEYKLRDYAYDERLISASDFPCIVRRYSGIKK